MKLRNFQWVILVLFFCSGATALVYEIVWSKFLSQMFGSTIYAQTVVLAVFMGGLALGNKVFGRWSDRLGQPMRAYGYLEIAIGIYAFLFPALDQLADRAFVKIGSGITQHTGQLLMLKGALSVGLLLGPTILMGGTLPLLCAWLQKSSVNAGRRSALFYAVNSLGAVAGALIAGFWIVQNLGMVASLQMTGLVNVIIGATAGLLSRSLSFGKTDATESSGESTTDEMDPGTLRWAGAIVGTTGAVSMGLEVLASRSLGMIFGPSLQSFAVVLMAFILGIGLGSAWIASPRRTGRSGEKTIVVLLCFAAAWITFLVFNIERWTDFYRIVRTGLAQTSVGYVFHELFTVGMSLIILGVPAACSGAVLPLMIRTVSRDGTLLGAKVGSLLTWNTLGAVVGTLLAGFVLMPLVGLRNAFGVLSLVLALAAVVTAWRRKWITGICCAVCASIFAASLFAFGGEGWRNVMSSGVFRAREKQFDPTTMALRKQHVKILFYEDAPDATVSVEQGDGIGAPADLGLRVNGKTDASTRLDYSTQLLVSHLPMLAKPGAKDVFIFGLGSGVSAGALRSYPVDRIVVAENCDSVIRASEYFTNWNRSVLKDPRVQLWHEDARTVLKLNPQTYDVIVAQPSNPWTIGIGSVFSREFYQIAASRLKPGGIMAQWFHVYEMHDGIVGLVLRTFCSEFPYVEVWDSNDGDIIMLGSFQPWPTGPEIFRQTFAIQGVQSDLAAIGVHSPEALLARQLASQRTGFAIASDGPIQSDLFPLLEYAAPRAFYIGESSHMFVQFDERTRQQALAPPEKSAVLNVLSAEAVQSVFSTNYTTINPELLASVRGRLIGSIFNTNLPPLTFSDASSPILAQAVTALNAGYLQEAGQLEELALKKFPDDPAVQYIGRIIEGARQLHN